MIIDAHQHFLYPSRESYPWLIGDALRPLMRDFAPMDLALELRNNGVDKTVLVQTKPSLDETRAFLKTAAETPYITGVVGWMDLTDYRVGKALDGLIRGPGGSFLVGVRHQVQDEPDVRWLLRDDVRLGLEALAARQLSFDLLIEPRHLKTAREIIHQHQNLTFVINHLANPDVQAGEVDLWSKDLRPLAWPPQHLCEALRVGVAGGLGELAFSGDRCILPGGA